MKSEAYNPDVLSCLANLSSDEVFTPLTVVNSILDKLPSEIWRDSSLRFLDPCSKSGVFLREIVKRLNDGLIEEFSNINERLNHIFEKQVFGLALTELTALLSRRTLYCSKKANGTYSLFDESATEMGNITFPNLKHLWKKGKCDFCGASQILYDRLDGLENYAYDFIHTHKPEELFGMKFDVIVGNPPYQLDTGGSGRQATPLYHKFVQQAKNLNPRYISMIIPSRWFAGGMGLDSFRGEMLADRRMKEIVDFVDARDCFPNVDIAGGVCYFLWDKHHNGEAKITNILKDAKHTSTRRLDEFETFVRLSRAVPILRKVLDLKYESLTKIISSTVPFGLKTSKRGQEEGDLQLISSAGVSFVRSSQITTGHDMINKWKVLTSKASHDHGGQPDKDGKRRVLSRLEVHPPKTVCTGSYILLGCFDTEQEAKNLKGYATTRIFRFLVSLLSFSQDITRERFKFVPLLDFNRAWTDEELADHFKLKKDELDVVSSLIREY